MAGAGGLSPDQREVVDAVESSLTDHRIVVALSGGADSAALAWAVVHLGAEARAVSVDHRLPGSARLMEAATQIAEKLGMPHVVVATDSDGTSETALRRSRLAALEEASEPGEVVMTGHTADDQAETVLGNLIRGAGAAGLAGIPHRRGRFVRPLLGIARSVTRAVSAQAGLPFADDPENADPSIWRNRIRSTTIPHLEEHYNPAVRHALVRAATLVGADDRLLERRAERVPVHRDEEAVVFPASALTALPLPIGSRVARRALRLALGPYPGDADDVAAVLESAATGVRASLSGGLLAAREGAWVAIYPADAPPPPPPVPLATTGTTRFGPWRIEPAGGAVAVGTMTATVPIGEGEAVVRPPLPGDRVAIGGGHHKTVADALSEAGVPERLRERWPLVEADDTITWIVGVRVAPTTGPTARLSATRERT